MQVGPPRRSWLCPTEDDHARAIQTYHVTAWARVTSIGGMGLALVAFGPRIGWWPSIAVAVVGLALGLLDVVIHRTRRAEWPLAATYMLGGAACMVVVGTTGGPTSPALPVFGVPVLLLANRFRPRVTYVGMGIALLMLWGSTVLVDPRAFWEDPSSVVGTTIVVAGITLMVMPLYNSEVHLFRRSHLDPLTGLMNRASLEGRFSDVVAQAAGTGSPVALIVLDLDRFKTVNDAHGHTVGDAVLRETATLIADRVRDSDYVYRLGGEEIGIVMPGMDVDGATQAAERLRRDIAAALPGGVQTTVSAGVAVSQGDASVTWTALYRRADGALLRAKNAGRDRVHVATDDDGGPDWDGGETPIVQVRPSS